MNPVIGHVDCPFCGSDAATVHREKRGPLYFRCYGGPHGDCGTVQIRYPGGQKWIKENMRPLEVEQQDKAAEEAAAAAREEAKEAARAARREAREEARQAPPPKSAGVGGIVRGMLDILGGEE